MCWGLDACNDILARSITQELPEHGQKVCQNFHENHFPDEFFFDLVASLASKVDQNVLHGR